LCSWGGGGKNEEKVGKKEIATAAFDLDFLNTIQRERKKVKVKKTRAIILPIRTCKMTERVQAHILRGSKK